MSIRRRAWGRAGWGLFLVVTCAAADQPIRVSSDANLQHVLDTARSGQTLVLATGEHRGPVTVSHPVTLRGEQGARLIAAGTGSVLAVQADGVRVENLEIRGSGRDFSQDDAGVLVIGNDVQLVNLHLRNNLHGIYVRGGQNVRIIDSHVIGLAATRQQASQIIAQEEKTQDMAIHHNPPTTRSLMGNGLHLWNASGAIVSGNHIQRTRDGIYVAHTNQSTFRDNRVHDSRYGIHYMYSNNNVIEHNELYRNVAGPALMFSRNLEVSDNILRDHSGFRAYGLLLQNVETSVIQRNDIQGNRVAIRLQNSYANTFRDNRVVGNLAGITLNSSSRNNVFTRNRFGPNLRQIELTGPVPPTQWSVQGVGNQWSGALPMDLTGDGVSQWPHHEVDLMAERREDFAPLGLLTGSLGIRVVEWALSHAPVSGMRYITDPHPLLRVPRHD